MLTYKESSVQQQQKKLAFPTEKWPKYKVLLISSISDFLKKLPKINKLNFSQKFYGAKEHWT